MIGDQMRKIFAYNTWAWQQVYDSVAKLPAAEYFAPRPIFFDSIHGALAHCLLAEYLWLERVNGRSPDALPQPEQFASFAALQERWSSVRHGWGNFTQSLLDERCQEQISYHTTEGHLRKKQLADILQHVVNHSTEHRSQITPILFHLGVPTRELDYIYYRR